jgi:hypothetical protein
MATILKIESKEIKTNPLQDFQINSVKEVNVKTIFPNMDPVIKDPIDFTHVSNTNKLTINSIVKVGIVSSTIFVLYYLSKTKDIFSYFGWKAKDLNSKEIKNKEITKIKNKIDFLNVRRNLKTTSQNNIQSINQITQEDKDNSKTVEFKEIKVKEFEDLKKAKVKKSIARRSIVVQNPISDQHVITGNSFNLTIDGTNVFKSASALSLENIGMPISRVTSKNPDPKLEGSCATSPDASAVVVSGNYAYIAAWSSGLQIIDISDPSNPTLKSSYKTPDKACGVALAGNYAYVSDYDGGLQIIDISYPTNPRFKGSYETPDPATNIAVSEHYAYVVLDTFYNNSLHVVDISDPSNPTFKGSCDIPSIGVEGITLSNSVGQNFAYVADSFSGLKIIDITYSSNPRFISSYDMPDGALGIAYYGNYVYVTGGNSGLQVVDVVTYPLEPKLIGSYDTTDYAYNVALKPYQYAYVTTEDGLQILNIYEVQDITLKSSCSTRMGCSGEELAISGNYVYLSDAYLINIISSNFDKLILSGTPYWGTHEVLIEAENEERETAIDSFYIFVEDSPTPNPVNLTIPLLIASMSCVVCITSFCCSSIIIGGIVGVILHRKKNKKISEGEKSKDPYAETLQKPLLKTEQLK